MTQTTSSARLKIGILASGAGTTAEHIINAIRSGDLPNTQVVAIISNNSGSGVLRIAEQYSIASYHISGKTHSADEFQHIRNVLEISGANFVLAAGYMKKIGREIFDRFITINTHPALLPKFGGRGMYGKFVHHAVIQAGDSVSGVTIHRVDGQYDKGDILKQIEVPVPTASSPELAAVELENVVKLQEKIMLVNYLKEYAQETDGLSKNA